LPPLSAPGARWDNGPQGNSSEHGPVVSLVSAGAPEYEHEYNQSFRFPRSTRHFGRIVDRLDWVGAARVLGAPPPAEARVRCQASSKVSTRG
jgi:hypothetical protein